MPPINDRSKDDSLVWQGFTDYLGDYAVKKQSPQGPGNILPYDENIAALMRVSSEHFEVAVLDLIELLK